MRWDPRCCLVMSWDKECMGCKGAGAQGLNPSMFTSTLLKPQCSPLCCLSGKIVGRGQGTKGTGLKCHGVWQGVCHCDSSLLNHGHLCADRDDCHIGENRKEDVDKTSDSPSGPGNLLSCSWSPEAVSAVITLFGLKGYCPGKTTSILDHLLALRSWLL